MFASLSCNCSDNIEVQLLADTFGVFPAMTSASLVEKLELHSWRSALSEHSAACSLAMLIPPYSIQAGEGTMHSRAGCLLGRGLVPNKCEGIWFNLIVIN